MLPQCLHYLKKELMISQVGHKATGEGSMPSTKTEIPVFDMIINHILKFPYRYGSSKVTFKITFVVIIRTALPYLYERYIGYESCIVK